MDRIKRKHPDSESVYNSSNFHDEKVDGLSALMLINTGQELNRAQRGLCYKRPVTQSHLDMVLGV